MTFPVRLVALKELPPQKKFLDPATLKTGGRPLQRPLLGNELVWSMLQTIKRYPGDEKGIHSNEVESPHGEIGPADLTRFPGDAGGKGLHAHSIQSAGHPLGQKTVADQVKAQFPF